MRRAYGVGRSDVTILLFSKVVVISLLARCVLRSVTVSMGHEADIVIVDFTSSDKAGFTADPNQLCVATTCARYGNFFVFNSNTATGGNLKALNRFCKGRGSVVLNNRRWDWTRFANSICSVCLEPHPGKCNWASYRCTHCRQQRQNKRNRRERESIIPLREEVALEEYHEARKCVRNKPQVDIVETDWTMGYGTTLV